MIPTKIPELNREQTEQLVNDINRNPTSQELSFWESAIKDSKKIKVK